MSKKQPQAAQSLEVAGLRCRYRRQQRKSLRIQLDADGDVWVFCPWYLPEFLLRRFLVEKLPWIHEQRARLQELALQEDDDVLLHLGETLRLQRCSREGRARVERQGDRLILYCPAHIDRAAQRLLLEAWQRRELERLLPAMIERWERAFGVNVAAWGIRRMRTRWGSCNTVARRLSFRLALVEMPLDCIDYVVAHECAHLCERHHNQRFYALLDAHLPNRRALEQQLQR
ncbi:SprT family zinc-dependent metalloprotease [Acidithiobacillus sp. AMEEHan]|uniref:M48 family metallopeptidase n=1 Tax=Acidithiobacillus sp. AMEEHan TaxID=2994951 RepID=UPI0027E5BA51|nr:SprT family zinc-dependent metalloprotease [Acidithiobacillus sp. AMEEHan]